MLGEPVRERDEAVGVIGDGERGADRLAGATGEGDGEGLARDVNADVKAWCVHTTGGLSEPATEGDRVH